MQRYFIEGKIPENQIVAITGDDAKHIAKVMRQTIGDDLIVVMEDQAYQAKIVSADFDVEVKIGSDLGMQVELPKKVTIACGLPKGDKLDLITQKATELGMYALLPFSAERSIVKWDSAKSEKKIGRLQKIAKEAAEQSHRTHVPEIQGIHSFKQLLDKANSYDAVIVAYEEEARQEGRTRFAEILKELYDKDSVLIIFGPEGGISQAEVASLKNAGASFTALGPRILRTETAPLYALSAISYEFE
ncbi:MULTISPECIES: 16S rRNA (uracil(1498)-N(3))-methyltransferase [Planococcus]|uniref:Ribosomal RNA small subunit methyltransferase E n=1 Tax=Planococcus faecalis TaxID=1598147 RepID=A0ABN4XQW8_9BACL|nr:MULTISPECIES: 16S rRNA (uracil(1498)-N(3))-methyltransferase [Planococcus]AQU79132.1 16S rRNA (uracil(1498)-N(3))-methyltransferase [Planococcus faecalis]MDJ0331074.1 16S rRNA (uracil(1498)-N(3))-methyltransferase [Planococcus sp. S3-L1]OHX51760.1 16S rRNA (uracil(1498)-N(3))-methyltransferase [Planococcus faecalis]